MRRSIFQLTRFVSLAALMASLGACQGSAGDAKSGIAPPSAQEAAPSKDQPEAEPSPDAAAPPPSDKRDEADANTVRGPDRPDGGATRTATVRQTGEDLDEKKREAKLGEKPIDQDNRQLGRGRRGGFDDDLAQIPEFAELQRLEAKLEATGVALPPLDALAEGLPATPLATAVGSNTCTEICDLQSAICRLEGRICKMASDKGDDARYENACQRAKSDCAVARNACTQCSAEQ